MYTLKDEEWHCTWCIARDGPEHRAGRRHLNNLIYYNVQLEVQQRWQQTLQLQREEQQRVAQWQQEAAFAPQLQLRDTPPPPTPGPPDGDGLIPPPPPPNARDVHRQLMEMTTIFQRQIDELVEKVANLEMRLMQVEQAPVNNWNGAAAGSEQPGPPTTDDGTVAGSGPPSWWQTPGHSWQQTDAGAGAAAAGSWPQPSGDGAVAASRQTPKGEGSRQLPGAGAVAAPEGSWQPTGNGAVAGSQQALGDAGSSTGDSAIADWERLKYH